MLRSEEMTLVQVIDHNDAARMVVTELGEVRASPGWTLCLCRAANQLCIASILLAL